MHMARHVSGDAGRLFRIFRRGLSSAPVFTKRILLVWHSRTGLARQMSDAAEMGAHAAAEEMGCGQSDFSVCLCSPLDPSLSGTIHLTTHLGKPPYQLVGRHVGLRACYGGAAG